MYIYMVPPCKYIYVQNLLHMYIYMYIDTLYNLNGASFLQLLGSTRRGPRACRRGLLRGQAGPAKGVDFE